MNWRKSVGVFLIFSSAIVLGGGWYVFAESQTTSTRAIQAWERADRQCIAALEESGQVLMNGPFAQVEMTLVDGQDWQAAVADASSLIGYCSTRRLTRLCLGRGCALAAGLPFNGNGVPRETLAEVQRAPLRLEFSLLQVRP
jgi:hypothetical protein